MLTEIIGTLRDISLRHKGVRTFRYQADDRFNAQNNYGTYQVYVDDINLHELNITTNVFVNKYEIYILAVPQQPQEDILRVQDEAFTIAVDIMAFIDEHYGSIMTVHDYAILTLSHFTSSDSAGVKLSLFLETASPLNLCTLDENFNDEPYEGEPDKEIDITENKVETIKLNPVKIKPTNDCR